jgi:hypothetical protein
MLEENQDTGHKTDPSDCKTRRPIVATTTRVEVSTQLYATTYGLPVNCIQKLSSFYISFNITFNFEVLYRFCCPVIHVKNTLKTGKPDIRCRPLNTIYRPLDTIYRPLNTIYRPLNTIYRPLNTIYRPLNTICRPLNTI